MSRANTDITNEELEYAIFCIENVANRLNKSACKVYDELNDSGILNKYIIKNYDILHTQGKDYIVDDILDTMKEWKD